MQLIYPIFLECIIYIDDMYWENIFKNLAYGISPKGTTIENKTIICKLKNKSFKYKITRKNPKKMYEELSTIFKTKLLLLSSFDKARNNNIIPKTKFTISEWSKIRKKTMKDNMIDQYIIEMKNKYNLSKIQTKYLQSFIQIAMVFKVITNKDIDFRNGKIVNINGVRLEQNKVIPQSDLYCNDVELSEEVHQTKCLSNEWSKYIKDIKKKYKIV